MSLFMTDKQMLIEALSFICCTECGSFILNTVGANKPL